MISPNIVRAERDGVEFFTVAETGESGMSGRGLAKALGVSSSSVSSILRKKAIGKLKGRWLEPLQLQDLYLQKAITSGQQNIINDKACVAIASHYAMGLKREGAVEFLAAFAAIGLRTYIQQQTGWSPQVARATKYLTGAVTPVPKEWSIHFCNEWQENAMRLTGYQWQCYAMANFINRMVYDYFPAKVREELDRANPPRRGQRRARKQHMHISNDVEHLLRLHISETLTIMQCAQDREQLDCLMAHRFKDGSAIGTIAECKKLALPERVR